MRSPTWGRLSLCQAINKVMDFVSGDKSKTYRFIIGTDSQVHRERRTVFVSTIIVHRVGYGAICFYESRGEVKKYSLRERMFTEVFLSLDLATRFLDELKVKDYSFFQHMGSIEIHVDVGENAATRDLVSAVTGMVKGCGFICRTKPEACGASTVADRLTKVPLVQKNNVFEVTAS